MRRTSILALILVLLQLPTTAGLASPSPTFASAAEPLSAVAVQSAEVGRRPIELPDILAWKSIRTRALAADGSWLGYVLVPQEGDSEVVVRSTSDETEHRFPIGEIQGFGGGRIAFSPDAGHFAFAIYPDRREGGAPARGGDRPKNAVGVVDLGSGEMRRFDNVRAFGFSGGEPGWLALHKYGADPAPAGQGGGRGPGGAGRGEPSEQERWTGSDLLLMRLADGVLMTVGNVSEFAFNETGRWLATALDTREGDGNGIQLHDLSNGAIVPVHNGEATYRRLGWTDEGDAFAVLRGVEDDDFEQDLHSVIGVADVDGDRRVVQFDPAVEDDFPAGMTISPNHTPAWNDQRTSLIFRIHDAEPKDEAAGDTAPAEAAEAETEAEADGPDGAQRGRDAGRGPGAAEEVDTADLVIWHWRDRRLQSMQQVQQARDRNFGYLSVYHVDDGRFVRLADDDLPTMNPAPGHRWAIGANNAPYERMGNLDGRRYQDVWVVDMDTGDRRLALQQARWVMMPSPTGTHLLYFADGHFRTHDLESGEDHNITEGLPVVFWNEDDDHNVVMPPINPFGLGWTEDGEHVLLSDNWDIWKIPAEGGGGENLTNDGRERQIRYRRAFRLDPDADGIDLSGDVYVTAYGEWTKKGGIGRLRPGAAGVEMLLWDDAAFSTLIKAEDADVYAYTHETHEQFPDIRIADASLADGREVTDANPQQPEFRWSDGARLLDYTSDKGDRLQAALYLPADYEPGRSYPTIVYIYERLSQGLNRYTVPTANGFNKSVYASQGYAVLMPDIAYQVDDPGMSSVWSVLPALDAAVETGIVDPDAVGLHGHSWGGYQTSFLITQTDRFSAAVAGAPLTNMISMYSLVYKNSGGGNGAIFEASQGRFTGGPWDVPEAYVRNSPVYHATNVTTPLVLLHNDLDGAVDFTQGVEYYNTLRRLDKNVVMLQYVGENHGLRKPANRKDYTVRMREFFDHYLRDLGMPGWLQEGVPYLQLEDHLEERARAIKEAVDAAKAAEAADEESADEESSDEESSERRSGDRR